MKRLTKSQYEMIAHGVKVTRTYAWADQNSISQVARELAHQLAQHDTEFDTQKFLTDCGITD